MVLKAAYAFATYALPTGYYWHTVIGVASLVVTYAFAQGKTTDRERDLHARTVLVTGAFTPLGLTTISNLASRGANIIAISPYPLDHPYNALIIPAMRTTTKNENIFAEHADLTSPASIRAFCTKFLTEGDQRLDAIVFAHEYCGVGSLFASTPTHEAKREAASLATFLIVTLLLPALLVAPVERDIRIVNVVNPFYAAAVPSFNDDMIASMAPDGTLKKRPLFQAEGHRALRTIVLTRHLQRILNALPNRAPSLDEKTPGGVPSQSNSSASTKEAKASTEDKSQPKFPSNIVAVSVAPGMSRAETIRVALGADKSVDPEGYSTIGFITFILFFPFIWLLGKSSDMAMQTVLHALFLPTPFKRALAHLAAATAAAAAAAENASSEAQKSDDTEKVSRPMQNSFTEILKPGALYRECSVVTVPIPPLPLAPADSEGEDAKSRQDKKAKANSKLQEEVIEIDDDGEYGGEKVGRLAWEWFEAHLKAWEAKEKPEEAKPEKPASP